MDLLVNKTNYFSAKYLLNGIIAFVLSTGSCHLSGAIYKTPFYPDSASHNTIQKEGFIKGRITQSATKAPVCFADIFNRNKTSFTKSNSNGEFILGPLEFPATLTIRKFGFKEETVIINNPGDPLLISLDPLKVNSSYSDSKKTLQYGLVFKKALGKLRVDYYSGSTNHSQRGLV